VIILRRVQKNYIISILSQQLKKLKQIKLKLSSKAKFSLIVGPLLVVGVLAFSLLFASYPSQETQATFSIPEQSLFVKSQRASAVPAPLRIVEGSVLQGNRTPGVVQPRTLGAVSGKQERTEITSYEVEEGDTVSSVAEEFGLKPETILGANDLTENSVLQPGDELTILPVDGIVYTVRQGDNISFIAQTYNTSEEKIVEYNELESKSDIFAGDPLVLPGGERPETVPAAEQVPVGENSLIYPAQGKITQSTQGVTHMPSMQAVDIANNCGSQIVAAAGGTVRRTGWSGMLGKRVTIEHPIGIVTTYGHLSQINVIPGQEVNQGQSIGRMGNTGYTMGHSGCHVDCSTSGTYNPLGSYAVGSYISW